MNIYVRTKCSNIRYRRYGHNSKYLLISYWIILKYLWNIIFRLKSNLSNMITVAGIMWFILFVVSRFNCFFNFLKRHTFYKLMTNDVIVCPNFPTIDKFLIFPKQYLWSKTNISFVKQFEKREKKYNELNYSLSLRRHA